MKIKKELEKSFITLIDEYNRVIYKICYGYSKDSEEFNDLYQDIVMNLWRSYANFRGDCKVSTWVYRIALNTAISLFRKDKTKGERVSLTSISVTFECNDERTAEINEMYQFINKLGKIERVLILLWLEDKSYDEIAEILGITKSNVAVKLNRAKNKLKLMYND